MFAVMVVEKGRAAKVGIMTGVDKRLTSKVLKRRSALGRTCCSYDTAFGIALA